MRTLTLCESGHELQAPGGSEVYSGPIQLVVVEERGGGRVVVPIGHMTDLHGSTCQLEPVQLLQSFFSTLCFCKLRHRVSGPSRRLGLSRSKTRSESRVAAEVECVGEQQDGEDEDSQ